MAELAWERIIDNLGSTLYRAQIFGGWLVKDKTGGVTFVANPELRWEVTTRPAVVQEPPRVTGPIVGGT